MAWTAEQWREKRRQQGVSPKADMPTIIPEHLYVAGRELNRMMLMPALDWKKEYGQEHHERKSR